MVEFSCLVNSPIKTLLEKVKINFLKLTNVKALEEFK